MTTYKTVNYENLEALREAINADLSTLSYPITVTHKLYGEGQLTYVKAPEKGGSLFLTIDFPAGNKAFGLDILMASKLLTMPEALAEILVEAQNAFKAEYEASEKVRVSETLQAHRQALEDRKKAQQEAKYKAAMESTIRNFEAIVQLETELSAEAEFYRSLGWLAKHCGVITAKLPDYLGSTFERYFGTDTPKTLIDTRGKTSGGYAKQWSWEFVCAIKKSGLTEVPKTILDTTTDISKGIHNTKFVWSLVSRYGFQFGKTQDLDKIRAAIPVEYLEAFERGYAE